MIQTKRVPRRDMVFVAGRRVIKLTGVRAEKFCGSLGLMMMDMGTMDVPKFKQLLDAIRKSTIKAQNHVTPIQINRSITK